MIHEASTTDSGLVVAATPSSTSARQGVRDGYQRGLEADHVDRRFSPDPRLRHAAHRPPPRGRRLGWLGARRFFLPREPGEGAPQTRRHPGGGTTVRLLSDPFRGFPSGGRRMSPLWALFRRDLLLARRVSRTAREGRGLLSLPWSSPSSLRRSGRTWIVLAVASDPLSCGSRRCLSKQPAGARPALPARSRGRLARPPASIGRHAAGLVVADEVHGVRAHYRRAAGDCVAACFGTVDQHDSEGHRATAPTLLVGTPAIPSSARSAGHLRCRCRRGGLLLSVLVLPLTIPC